MKSHLFLRRIYPFSSPEGTTHGRAARISNMLLRKCALSKADFNSLMPSKLAPDALFHWFEEDLF